MICHRIGCAHEATHAPKVCVPRLGRPRPSPPGIATVLTLGFCEACAAELTGADFLAGGDRARENLRQAVGLLAQGAFLPDFDAAWVEPVPMASDEYLAVEARVRGLSS